MLVTIHPNALKHGLTEEQVVSAYESAVDGGIIRSRDRSSDPQRYATVGFDHAGRPIELVFIKQSDGQILIFHANYLTRGFEKEYSDGIRRG